MPTETPVSAEVVVSQTPAQIAAENHAIRRQNILKSLHENDFGICAAAIDHRMYQGRTADAIMPREELGIATLGGALGNIERVLCVEHRIVSFFELELVSVREVPKGHRDYNIPFSLEK